MADRRPPLIVDLSAARHALWLNQQFARNAPRRDVIDRFLTETREGFHRPQLQPRLAPGARA